MAKILSGWKDIATYLKKNVDTVQGWDREYPMPLLKIKRDVYATEKQLDQWLQQFARKQNFSKNTPNNTP